MPVDVNAEKEQQHVRRRSDLQSELARQRDCAPQCLSEKEALQLASLHSVSQALLLLSEHLERPVHLERQYYLEHLEHQLRPVHLERLVHLEHQ